MLKRLRKSVLKRWAALIWRHNFRVAKRNNVPGLRDYRNFVGCQLGVLGGFGLEQRAYLAFIKALGYAEINRIGKDSYYVRAEATPR